MSGRIPRQFIDELLVRSDLVEIINSRVTLKKRGANYVACCPFHQEKTPSFTVQPEKQFYYCFGCGASGNALGFLMQYDAMEFIDAVHALAEHYGMTVPVENASPLSEQPPAQDLYQCLEKVAQFYQQQLRRHPQAHLAVNYLKSRGLSGEIAKQFGIGFAPPGWDNVLRQFGQTLEKQNQLFDAGLLIKKDEGGYYDRFRARVMFPIRNRRGFVIGFGGRVLDEGSPKYLNSPETPIFHKGDELYGLYESKKQNRKMTQLLIVEGYLDVVALFQYGINNVAATLGTATSAAHIQAVFRLTDKLIFAFDGDAAGKTAAKRALEVALPLVHDQKQVYFLFFPQGEDPDSLIRKEGRDKFVERINTAQALSEFFVDSLLENANGKSIQDQAAIVNLADKFFVTMPESRLKELLKIELAKHLRIDEAKLLRWLQNESKSNQEWVDSGLTKMQSPMRQAIALLLQYPKLIALIEDQYPVTELSIPGTPLFLELIHIIQAKPELNMGAILEYWRDKEGFSHLAKLASQPLMLPDEGLEAEFKAVLMRLMQLNRNQKVEKLLSQANQRELTDDERQQLHKLLSIENK